MRDFLPAVLVGSVLVVVSLHVGVAAARILPGASSPMLPTPATAFLSPPAATQTGLASQLAIRPITPAPVSRPLTAMVETAAALPTVAVTSRPLTVPPHTAATQSARSTVARGTTRIVSATAVPSTAVPSTAVPTTNAPPTNAPPTAAPPTTIAPLANIPAPPSTLPLATRAESAHVSPLFAELSVAGFAIVLALVGLQWILTWPRRRGRRTI